MMESHRSCGLKSPEDDSSAQRPASMNTDRDLIASGIVSSRVASYQREAKRSAEPSSPYPPSFPHARFERVWTFGHMPRYNAALYDQPHPRTMTLAPAPDLHQEAMREEPDGTPSHGQLDMGPLAVRSPGMARLMHLWEAQRGTSKEVPSLVDHKNSPPVGRSSSLEKQMSASEVSCEPGCAQIISANRVQPPRNGFTRDEALTGHGDRAHDSGTNSPDSFHSMESSVSANVIDKAIRKEPAIHDLSESLTLRNGSDLPIQGSYPQRVEQPETYPPSYPSKIPRPAYAWTPPRKGKAQRIDSPWSNVRTFSEPSSDILDKPSPRPFRIEEPRQSGDSHRFSEPTSSNTDTGESSASTSCSSRIQHPRPVDRGLPIGLDDVFRDSPVTTCKYPGIDTRSGVSSDPSTRPTSRIPRWQNKGPGSSRDTTSSGPRQYTIDSASDPDIEEKIGIRASKHKSHREAMRPFDSGTKGPPQRFQPARLDASTQTDATARPVGNRSSGWSAGGSVNENAEHGVSLRATRPVRSEPSMRHRRRRPRSLGKVQVIVSLDGTTDSTKAGQLKSRQEVGKQESSAHSSRTGADGV
ncbi:MAG: hypothetical protein Q9183_000118 [Haloplaca sp. 2 TL-2023]